MNSIHNAEVIVCVHNALEDVRRCLAAFDANTNARHRLVLVDDGSEPACRAELERYAMAHPTTVLLRSDERLGYTRAANRGLRHSGAEFVVLLNSDTIVTPSWLEHLLECAASDTRIGIASPLSNSATFQSVPERYNSDEGWVHNPLPAGWQPDDMARAIAAMAPRDFPRVGFLNGFCFLIKRAVIDEIGYFDEIAFPDGYGEEQDYCFRASKAGFDLAVADQAYVYHAGTRSYRPEQRQELKLGGRAALTRKHKAKRIRAAIAKTYNDSTLARMRHDVAEALHGMPPRPESPVSVPECTANGIKVICEPALDAMARPTGVVRSSPGMFQKLQETQAIMQHEASLTSRQNPLLWSFMGELDTQCANAELAYTALVMALSERAHDGSRGRAQQRKVFFYAHAFMVHAAMISRILWPSREAHAEDFEQLGIENEDALKAIRKERSKRLRKALGSEVSLLKELSPSDYLERYDARFEVWAILSLSDDARDMAIGPADVTDGGEPAAIIRHFDPIAMTYTFLGTPYDLASIAAVLSWTHRSVARWVSGQEARIATSLPGSSG